MIVDFDILLSTAALVIMLAGFGGLWARCRRGRAEEARGSLGDMLAYLLGQGRILRRPGRGAAHLLAFWGVVVPLALVIFAQFSPALPAGLAAVLSVLTDLLGLALLAGVLFFLLRSRGGQQPRYPQGSLLPALLLLFIALSGFLAEGSRMAILAPAASPAAPVGWVFAQFAPASPVFMQVMIRLHFFAVLVFIAAAPFTFMRHLVSATLNIYYQGTAQPRGRMRAADLGAARPGAGSPVDLTWRQLLESEACVSCGRCQDECPAYLSGKPLSPRKVMQDIRSTAEAAPLAARISPDEVWACTTCQACVEQCPLLLNPMDKLLAVRRHSTLSAGALPAEARPLIRDLEVYGDASGKGAALREDWALGLEVKRAYHEPGQAPLLLWVGCSGAFHPRYQQVTRAMVEILEAAGVDFAVAGKRELCCGDPARRLGQEELFLSLAQENIRRLAEWGVEEVVALCPHCFNTLKNEYPVLGAGFKTTSAMTFIAGLIREKRITPRYPVPGVLAIHDPCYLGRVNGIYDDLREVARALPGAKLQELSRSRETGFCCGGGGGRMWLHENQGRGINQMRSEQVLAEGVELVGTACPYCLTMLEDGLNGLEVDEPPKCADLIEMVAGSL